jgi:hypothetical protein
MDGVDPHWRELDGLRSHRAGHGAVRHGDRGQTRIGPVARAIPPMITIDASGANCSASACTTAGPRDQGTCKERMIALLNAHAHIDLGLIIQTPERANVVAVARLCARLQLLSVF